MKDIIIGKKKIGINEPCYVIAEAGVNHNGKLDLALKLIDEAVNIGADCVKFQTFVAEKIITKNAPKANYQLQVTDPKESQFTMLKNLELNREDYLKLIEHCKKKNIQFLSTPYNKSDADFLNELGVDAFKVASGQLIELNFLKHLARFNKPIIISCGMATLAEVYEGIQAIKEEGNDQIVLLQCTTNYPSKIEDSNILAMNSLHEGLNVIVGYSDHVENNYACFAAAARGAKVIEKHFTLDRTMAGPDHKASLDPKLFGELIYGIRQIELSLGSKVKSPTAEEKRNSVGMRRSLVTLKDLKKGHVITTEDIDFKRPATGLKPQMFDLVIGKKIANDIEADVVLNYKDINWE